MATKECKRQVRELLQTLELRAHRGPPVLPAELQSLKTYLQQHDFSPASDYFARLTDLESRLRTRAQHPVPAETKRNYGGEAAGCQMQVQSIYDHLILSTCYGGEFNGKRGRVKLSHRFNREGRVDFVELKYLRSLHPALNGELRKLLLVKNYQSLRKDWLEAEALVLRILPQELVFLYPDIFRCDRMELFAWLANIGHGLLSDLLTDLRRHPNRPAPRALQGPEGLRPAALMPAPGREPFPLSSLPSRLPDTCPPAATVAVEPPVPLENPASPSPVPNLGQLPLSRLAEDRLALPILEKAALLEAVVEPLDPQEVLVRYLRRPRPPS